MANLWWEQVRGAALAQGDYLTDCIVPLLPNDFIPPDKKQLSAEQPTRVPAVVFDLIVVTQTCDLENRKARLVAACPIFTLAEYEEKNPALKREWESVRQGRREGLHLLAAFDDPAKNREAFVVDFREIYSLPLGYLMRHAESQLPRMRLCSPYLEHFSQAFARFFMRVGLPSSIPAFK